LQLSRALGGCYHGSMKMLFRWAFRIFILLVVLLVAGILLLDTIARSIAENRIRNETGMDVKMGSLSLGLLSPVITIENFKLYNTAEFGGSPFVEVPELHVEYDRSALFSRKLHCRLVRFDLAQVNVVQRKDGKTNIQALEETQRKAMRTTSGSGSKGGARFQFTGIEILNLSLGKATHVNLSNPSQVKEVNLNIRNQIIPNIKTEQDLESILAALVLSHGGMPFLDLFSTDSSALPKPANPAAVPKVVEGGRRPLSK
jgi:uncharacterized protein involved in outer membrane biogenesis